MGSVLNFMYSILIERFQFSIIIMAISLVYFKPNEDILQGINKLDHLL